MGRVDWAVSLVGFSINLGVGHDSYQWLCRRLVRDWQLDGYTRTVRLHVFYSEISATFLDDPVTDAQPQSRSFADGFRRIKRVKRAVQIAKARASIFYFDHVRRSRSDRREC